MALNRLDRTPKELTCEPLMCIKDMKEFLKNPPQWSSLCEPLRHNHSKYAVINSSIHCEDDYKEYTQTFCHINKQDLKAVKRQKLKKLPRTLVCHDYANGYHDDSKVDGSDKYDAYTFYNWSGIDIFCYFSHRFITIPPVAWINVGHAHGVKVLGTVITEWSQGIDFWDYVLAEPQKMQLLVSGLVGIAKLLKFEGWLLNIENKVNYPEELVTFVRELHTQLHAEVPDAELIWYDSVTADGTLNWQNKLNDRNRVFFEACDGLFTNYSWTEEDVEQSAEEAGDRRFDVYIGIDIWGRNFFGGGQFNTYRALAVASSYGCSVAIFAQAWTYEAISDKNDEHNIIYNGEDLSRYDVFLIRDRALWTLMWPYLKTRLPAELPFQTSFCRGQGQKRRTYGEVICPSPWYNLRHMQYQPNSNFSTHGFTLLSIEVSTKVKEILAEKKEISSNTSTTNAAEVTKTSLGDRSDTVTESKDKTKEYVSDMEVLKITHEPENVHVAGDLNPEIIDFKVKEQSLNENEIKENPDSQEIVTAETQEQEQSSPKNFSTHPGAADLERLPEKPMLYQDTADPSVKSTIMHMFRMRRRKSPPDEETDADGMTESLEELETRAVTASLQMKLKIDAGKRRYQLMYLDSERECLEPYYLDSFTGGSCLCVHPSDEVDTDHRTIRLFHTDFDVNSSIVVCVVTKPLFGEQHLDVELVLDVHGQERVMKLLGDSECVCGAELENIVCPINDKPVFTELRKYMLVVHPEFYVPVENPFGWRINYYFVTLSESRITSVLCRPRVQELPILLGHFGICPISLELAEQLRNGTSSCCVN